jgi:acetyltransferase-like isoleucine patch superfamily enzyme
VTAWHESFEIDATAQISRLADLEPSVRGSRLIVGARSAIDAFVKIKFAGGAGDIIIGEDCRINSGCVIYGGHGVRFGNEVLIAAGSIFVPANHAVADVGRSIRVQGHLPSKGGVMIEDDVWIGANCVFLDGAIVRRGSVINAGSVVSGEIAPYSIAGGSPCRVLKPRAGSIDHG